MVRQNWRVWFGAADVDAILKEAASIEVSEATTFGGENLDVRRSKVGWLTKNKAVNEIIMPYADEARKLMAIDATLRAEIQYTEYHGSNAGKYDWHHDVDWNAFALDRKLSMTIQLSDPSEYEGGEFEFDEVEQLPMSRLPKGTVVVFPSYLRHRVLPVTSGVRKTLVAWFNGPRWR